MRAARVAKPHYLHRSKTNWSPDSVISFDTETLEHSDGDDLVLTPRCWSAVWRLRHDSHDHLARKVKRHGTDMGELAAFVAAAVEAVGETWVYAHNLGFDLSVSALPFRLVRDGWHLEDFMLTGESCWWVLKRGTAKVIFTDSWSWLRCSLEEAAKDFGRRKRPLPKNDAPLSEWLGRCDKDAELLDEIVTELMDWWDGARMGRWQITGSGCGWATAKHLMPEKGFLVGYEQGRTELERRAIHGGRKEVYRVGAIYGTSCADFDFQTAYHRIAAGHQLPTRPGKAFGGAPSGDLTIETPGTDYIAEVEVLTDEPVAPVKIDGNVWWPTGRFRTVLTGPEVRYALSRGAQVTFYGGQHYKMGFALADWANWSLGVLEASTDQVPKSVRRLVKHWGRAVIGRFAARSSALVDTRPADRMGWHLSAGNDLDTGALLEVLSIDGTEYTLLKDQEGTDAFPAVFAFVEAYCRVALARMLDSRKQDRLLQCNTDGWLERQAARVVPLDLKHVPEPHAVVRKGSYREVVILGPNHLELGVHRRMSGLALSATEGANGKFQWHDWPSLRWQLEHGEQGTYRRPPRELEVKGPFVRRWVLVTGETLPVTCAVDQDGTTRILHWSETWGRRESDRLAPRQVAELDPLTWGRDWTPAIMWSEGAPMRGRHWDR